MTLVRVDRWWRRGACYSSFDLRCFGSRNERKQFRDEYCTKCTVKAECAAAGDGLGVRGGEIGRGTW